MQFEEISPISSSHLPSSTANSDSDSDYFPPTTSSHKVDRVVSSSSSHSLDYKDEYSPPPSLPCPVGIAKHLIL